MFQHTAARRRLDPCPGLDEKVGQVSTHSRPKAAGRWGRWSKSRKCRFQHPAARRRLGRQEAILRESGKFQHTAARRRLGQRASQYQTATFVSTHSRPKAAGHQHQPDRQARICFNTQPPEGGWACVAADGKAAIGFQHTAARRRLG